MAIGTIGSYVYRLGTKTLAFPVGTTEICLLWAIDYHQTKQPLSLKSIRNVLITGSNVGAGSTGLYYSKHSKRVTRIFPNTHGIFGSTVARVRSKLQADVERYFLFLERNFSDLSVEYGLPMVLVRAEDDKLCVGETAVWSGFVTGIRRLNDRNVYTAWSSFGSLDLIKHDEETGREISREDIRSGTVIQTENIGDLRIDGRQHDFSTFLERLRMLLEYLKESSEEKVVIEWLVDLREFSSGAV